MRTLANIIWILLGGLLVSIAWCLLGVLFYITIIGIPFGRQCFKMARLSLAPFGLTVNYGGGAPSLIANIIWVIFAGIPMALSYLLLGAGWCVTIVGIPFGIQLFKMAQLSLMPFGSEVTSLSY